MGVIPNPKMAFIFPISCILALIFPILIKYFPKCVGKGSFPKSQIKSLDHDRNFDFSSTKGNYSLRNGIRPYRPNMKLEKDILVLKSVNLFNKIVIKITALRDGAPSKMVNFHEKKKAINFRKHIVIWTIIQLEEDIVVLTL